MEGSQARSSTCVIYNLSFITGNVVSGILIPSCSSHPQGGEIPQLFDVCRSDGATIWIPILLVYKSLFLLVGLFLASQTFSVKIKELRDSKLIVTSVFSITVISIATGLVAFLLTNNPDATYSLIGLFILLLVTAILILLFVTRVSSTLICDDCGSRVM